MAWENGSIVMWCGFEVQNYAEVLTIADGDTSMHSDDTTNFNTGACSLNYAHTTTDGDGVRGRVDLAAARARTMIFAFRLDSSTTPAASNRGVGICGFHYSAGASSNIPGWGVYWDGTNYQGCIMNAGGTIASTPAWRGTVNLSLDTWYYFNILYWNPNPNEGATSWHTIFEIRTSTGTLHDRSPITKVALSSIAETTNSFWFGNSHSIASWHLEYNIDDLGIINGGVLGPKTVHIERVTPDGVGSEDSWTSSVPGNKWLDTDEAPTDTTDYNYSTTISTQLYTHSGGPTLAGSEEHFGVCLWNFANCISRTGNIFILCRLKGTVANNGAGLFNPSSYDFVWYPAVRQLTAVAMIPIAGGDGGVAWDSTSIDALEYGMATTGGSARDVRVAQSILEVAYGLAQDNTYGVNSGLTIRETNVRTSDRKPNRAIIGRM